MLRRNICNEAGARSDGLMFVSVLFITAFTYIALTTNPVYTGIGVGDRAPDLSGQVWDGNSWTDFDLQDNIDSMWSEGDGGTYYMIEFMDTNCGACIKSASEITNQQSKWTGDNPTRSMPENVTVEFLAVSISLRGGTEGWDTDRLKSPISGPNTNTHSVTWMTMTTITVMSGEYLELQLISSWHLMVSFCMLLLTLNKGYQFGMPWIMRYLLEV